MSPVRDPMLRLPDVCKATGYRRSSVYSFIQARRFPAPVRFAGASLWPLSSIEAWLDCVREGREWHPDMQAEEDAT